MSPTDLKLAKLRISRQEKSIFVLKSYWEPLLQDVDNLSKDTRRLVLHEYLRILAVDDDNEQVSGAIYPIFRLKKIGIDQNQTPESGP